MLPGLFFYLLWILLVADGDVGLVMYFGNAAIVALGAPGSAAFAIICPKNRTALIAAKIVKRICRLFIVDSLLCLMWSDCLQKT